MPHHIHISHICFPFSSAKEPAHFPGPACCRNSLNFPFQQLSRSIRLRVFRKNPVLCPFFLFPFTAFFDQVLLLFFKFHVLPLVCASAMPVFYHIPYISIEVRLAQLKQRFLHFLMTETISIHKPMDRFPILFHPAKAKLPSILSMLPLLRTQIPESFPTRS